MTGGSDRKQKQHLDLTLISPGDLLRPTCSAFTVCLQKAGHLLKECIMPPLGQVDQIILSWLTSKEDNETGLKRDLPPPTVSSDSFLVNQSRGQEQQVLSIINNNRISSQKVYIYISISMYMHITIYVYIYMDI